MILLARCRCFFCSEIVRRPKLLLLNWLLCIIWVMKFRAKKNRCIDLKQRNGYQNSPSIFKKKIIRNLILQFFQKCHFERIVCKGVLKGKSGDGRRLTWHTKYNRSKTLCKLTSRVCLKSISWCNVEMNSDFGVITMLGQISSLISVTLKLIEKSVGIVKQMWMDDDPLH